MNFLNILLISIIALLLSACSNENEGEKENKVLYWVAPMDASYRRDEAGKSPMGMDLVPVYEEKNKEDKKEKKILYWVAPMDATQ